MLTNAKPVTLVLTVSVCFLLLSIVFDVPMQVSCASSPAPATEWQQQYGNRRTQSVSTVIQTIDGGYAFIDLGWTHQSTLTPSTVYKVNSLGNLTWQKTIKDFIANRFIQTSDGGYEVWGNWDTYGTTYQKTPAMVKLDGNGNIQWTQNCTDANPNQNREQLNQLFNETESNVIQTSDGGYAYATVGYIVKANANREIEWTKNVEYTYSEYPGSTFPLKISYVTEASDGSLVGIGTGSGASPSYFGYIYLIKTEPFLPIPTPTPALPSPVATETINTPITNSQLLIGGIAVFTVITILAILLWKRTGK